MKRLTSLFLAATFTMHAQEPAKPQPAPAPAPALPAFKAPEKPKNVKNVTPEEAEKLIKEGVTVVDVRTLEEWEHEHIKGSKNVDMQGPEAEAQVAKLDQSKPIIVHCAAGRRSQRAIMDTLSKLKFPTIYHMNSGLSGWKEAKKPVEAEPTPAQSGKIPDRLK